MTENNYHILAIDDHPIVLQGIQALATELHNVSCTTKTDIRLEDLPEDSAFDLCILDLGLCGKQSGDFIARLRTRMPSCRILVYTMHEEPWIADELVGLDVEGAVSKNSPLDELQQAIRHLRCGLSYYDPVFTRLMRPKALNRLTLKEAQVLCPSHEPQHQYRQDPPAENHEEIRGLQRHATGGQNQSVKSSTTSTGQ